MCCTPCNPMHPCNPLRPSPGRVSALSMSLLRKPFRDFHDFWWHFRGCKNSHGGYNKSWLRSLRSKQIIALPTLPTSAMARAQSTKSSPLLFQ